MLRLASNQQPGSNTQPIRVVDDHVASPTYAPLLAARSADLVDRGLTGSLPRRRWRSPFRGSIIASMIFRIAGVNPELKPTNETRILARAARRPKYSALSNAKMERSASNRFPPLETAVRLYMAGARQRVATMSSGD